ncbi:hypothetical protein HFO68_34585 [Rhizobium laguerreae]|uniref:hypothetical protein n=1 Tax=Rhizobium laguerreae TaxID=1076926 RepID=UPI001C905F8A|nr:hypothetical protein [Rhizobium laguerreae]MBY3109591.1 hypothetical protein [Rhizobium laguerreae]
MENIVKPAHIANVDFDVPCTLSLQRGSITGITSDHSYGHFAMPPTGLPSDTPRIRRTPMRIALKGFPDFFAHNCRKPANPIVMINVAAKTA